MVAVGLVVGACRPEPAVTPAQTPRQGKPAPRDVAEAESVDEDGYSLERHRSAFLQALDANAEIRALAEAGVPTQAVRWKASTGLRFMWELIAWSEDQPLDWRSSIVARVMFESGAAVGAMAVVFRDDLPTTRDKAKPIEVLLTPPREAPESEPLRARIASLWSVELEPSAAAGASFQGFVVATELARDVEGFSRSGEGSWTLVRFERPARALLALDFDSGRGEFLPESKSDDPGAFARALAGAVR